MPDSNPLPQNTVASPPMARSTIGRMSRSAVGRISGRVTRLFGGSATVQATAKFLRRQMWSWPIIAAVILGLTGWWASGSVEESMRDRRTGELQAILQADVTALRLWMQGQEENARLFGMDERLQPMVNNLLGVAGGPEASERPLLDAKGQAELRARLGPRIKPFGYTGFLIVAPSLLILAADQDTPVGKPTAGNLKAFFQSVLAGKPSVSQPFRSPLLLLDEDGEWRAGVPSMFAAAPINGESGKAIAALALRIRPEVQFTKILQVARSGHTGETYAFDRKGLFLSQSRFDDDLKQIGLLADQPDVKSILTLEARDPQIDLTTGARPKLRRAEQPLTRMAADAVAGNTGLDVDGYRDYRGAQVIGAWTWLPEYDMGVATEVDVAESFSALYALRRIFLALMILLGVSAVVIFGFMVYTARQHRHLQEAVLAAKHLGQYTLEDKLGAGGMGTVYRARHAMLRRPTAVKLLDVDKMSDAAIVRFEREVQLTSGLNHPNTVAIFDYGRTPEGIFYYAMEYLDGANLEDFVRQHGSLPEARMAFILRQVCGSLAEAHAAGLVHRDVKPANIFLTCRGGMHDFVKVLDFGLVKAVDGGEAVNVTSANAATGTPLYMAPEAVNHPEQVDARTDVYAIGAVGYFLLTGTPVFTGASVMEVCMKHVQVQPEPPSVRLDRPVSATLEALLLRCLAKSRTDRPADATNLLRELEKCSLEGAWTADDAANWWAVRSNTAHAQAQSAAETSEQVVNPDPPAAAATMDYNRG